jgi:hypothetical protein
MFSMPGAHLQLCDARAGTRTAWRRPSDAPARRGAGSVRSLQPRARPAALLHDGVLRAGALFGR